MWALGMDKLLMDRAGGRGGRVQLGWAWWGRGNIVT